MIIQPFWYQRAILSLSLVWVCCLTSMAESKESSLDFQVMDDESYAESVTAVALLENGDYLLLQAMLTNAGIGDEKGACRILHVPFGKAGVNEVDRDGDDWSYAKVTQTLKISSCEMITSHEATIFKARTESMHAHLTFPKSTQRIVAPSATVKVDDEESFSSDILIPWSQVVLKLKKGNHSQVKFKGYGYLDHGRSNTLLPKVAKSWFRFRGFKGDQKVLFEYRRGAKKQKNVAWLYTQKEKMQSLNATAMKSWTLTKSKNASLTTKKGKKTVKIPQVSFTLGDKKFTIQAQSAVYYYEPAKAYGLLGKLAKNWVGDPLTQTYIGVMTWPDGSTTEGVIEHILIRK